MSRRSKARVVAVQMLYQLDLNPEAGLTDIRQMVFDSLRDEELRDLAWRLFVGVREMRPLLDEKILSVAENWTLKRMAPTDRNVLRLGLYELLHTDTPHRVVLDEAIELARLFGSAHSAQFVNGILDRLMPEKGPLGKSEKAESATPSPALGDLNEQMRRSESSPLRGRVGGGRRKEEGGDSALGEK